MKLRKTHYEQIFHYADHSCREGNYYGNKRQFEKRHFEIMLWLLEQLPKDEKDFTDSFKNRDGL